MQQINNIGFGCSKLTSNYSKKSAIKNLEVAFDNGITHFDVARLYGHGLAEGILGDFIKDKRNQVTITTKTGLFPNGNSFLKNLFLQNVTKTFYKQLKKIKRTKAKLLLPDTMIKSDFAIKAVEKSIKTSLEQLHTDYIDFFLLHEATIDQAKDLLLMDFLENCKKKGLIKSYGIASYHEKIKDTLKLLPGGYTVIQTNSSYPISLPVYISGDQVTDYFYFSPFQNLKMIESLLKAEKHLAGTVSDLLEFDVSENVVDMLLLQQNLNDKPGTFLFTTADNSKIIQTVNRWRHVQTLNVTPENFEKARILINSKLTMQCL